jgi:hypothetical protein
MTPDPSRFVVGDEWVYRVRDDSPSERVRIIGVTLKKRSARVDIEFLDDTDHRVENVPGSRLRASWCDRESFDALMANWARISDLELDDVEQACVEEVFQLLISDEVAELLRSPVICAARVLDQTALTTITGVPTQVLLESCEWFDQDGEVVLSPAGTLLVVESACHANSGRVLDVVMEQEAIARHKCKHGGHAVSVYTGEDEPTSPEWEFDWYTRHDRPRHELLRQWCGHRAITFHERLLAAEAETQRLDVLVTDLIKAVAGAGDERSAERFAVEHERDRVTPDKIRPLVDRPLDPSEIPVREVRVRRHWR